MLHINDADQPAIPADENMKQEHSELEPLPWEAGKASLFNFTKTITKLLLHPRAAFRSGFRGNASRAYIFFTIVFLIVHMLDGLYILLEQVSSLIRISGVANLFETDVLLSLAGQFSSTFISRLHLIPITTLLLYLPLSALLHFCYRAVKVQCSYSICYKVLLYSDVSMLLVVVPYVGLFFGSIGKTLLLIIGLREQTNTSWTSAVLLGLIPDALILIYTFAVI